MSKTKSILNTEALEIAADDTTGGIASLRLYGRELLEPGCRALSDLSLNGRPLDLRVTPHTWTNLGGYPSAGNPVNEMHASEFLSHYTGFGLDVTRSIRAIRPELAALTYTVQRVKIRTLPECPGPGWGAIEAPLYINSLTAPCLPWKFFGEKTRMILLNSGSNGPRNHIGYENGTVREVKKKADTWFRRQYAGVLGFPGSIFYDAETEHWLAITCRRPQIAYNLNHEAADEGVAFDFLPMGQMGLSQTVQLPQILIHVGRTQDEREQFLADEFFRHYEEPSDWVFHTTWADIGMTSENFRSWKEAHRAALDLVEGGGASGLFLITHDRNLAYGGTSPKSAGPSEELGPRRDFEAMIRDLKGRGIRLMSWLSTCGLNPQGDADPDWFIRGIDSDWLSSWGLTHQPHIVYPNPLHPGWLAYNERWIKYYVGELGFDSIHFDCAGFVYPCDFVPRTFQRYPSDVMLGHVKFFDFVRDVFHRVNPEAAIFTEGHCVDSVTNITSLMTNETSEIDGLSPRQLALSLQSRACKRISVRSGFEGDLGSGYVTVNHDTQAAGLEQYRAIGADPFNVALTKFVREHGSREARSLPCGSGVSLMKDHLFVPQPREDAMSPAALVPAPPGPRKASGISVQLPPGITTCTNILNGKALGPDRDGSFVFFDRGIYKIA